MAWTIDDVLKEPELQVVTRDEARGIFEIKIGNLETVVSIQLGRWLDSETTNFDVSHAIKTPVQSAAYRTSRPFADYPGYALRQAVMGILSYYRDAVKQGYRPDESWLVRT